MKRRLLTLLAETPVHAGGPESLAAVDLPIQREAATGLPVIWGQSLKGALRQAWRDANLPDQEAVFGSRPPDAGGDEPAGDDGDADGALIKGALSVGDAQLLLFPAATLRQVFGWATSPLLLSRLGRKLRLLGADPAAAWTVPNIDGQGLGSSGWEGRQVIGPFLANIRVDAHAGALGAMLATLVCPDHPAFDYTRRKMSADVLLVDELTIAGLAKMGTDVVARVQLEENTKKVANLFYSEHLPAETVLAALLTGTEDHLDRLATLLDGHPVQLGGDETIGKGVLWCRVHSASTADAIVKVASTEVPTEVVAAAPAPLVAPAAPPIQHRPSPAAMARRKHG
jgi:CRISPR-associated protein Cmr4